MNVITVFFLYESMMDSALMMLGIFRLPVSIRAGSMCYPCLLPRHTPDHR
jgi:hypothetical protein